jgi:hypothetical protein
MKQTYARLALFAVALVASFACTTEAAAQLRPGMGRPGIERQPPFRLYGVAGYAQMDVDELNARLTSLDEPYTPVSEDMIVFGGGLHGRMRRLILGGEVVMQASIEDAEAGEERKAELSAFNASGLLGFSIIQTDGFDFYPLVQAGFASVTLEVNERGDPSWDDVLADPGRRSTLNSGTFYGAGGVGMDYVFSGGFFMGVRGTYAWTPPTDSWTEESGNVLGGPEMDLSGPSVRLLIGIGGR